MKPINFKRSWMYPAILSMIVTIALVTGCTKDDDSGNTLKSFDELTLADLKSMEASLTVSGINISDASGIQLKAGYILVYRTNLGNLGKLEILSIDPADNYKITLKARTYASDGTVVAETSSLAIRGTWLCDLDSMSELDENSEVDFWHERLNSTDSIWVPKNGAVFFRYTT